MLLEIFNRWLGKRPNEKIPDNSVINKITKTKSMAITADKLNKILKNNIYKNDISESYLSEGWFENWARGRIEMEERNAETVNHLLDGLLTPETPIDRGKLMVTAAQQNAVEGIKETARSFKDGFLSGIFDWFDRMCKVFNKPIFGIALKSWLLWGAVIIVLVTVCYFSSKYIIKKLKQKKINKINEVSIKYMKCSETNFLSKHATTETFLKAKAVAHYLKENTSMSKKDCNKIANFVYNKELAESDQGNITTSTTKKSKISKYLAAGVAALASIGINLKLSSVLEKVGPVIDDPSFMTVYAGEAHKAAVRVLKERISKEITVEPARATPILNKAIERMQTEITAANGDLARTAEVYYKYSHSPDAALGIMDKLAIRLNIKLFNFKPVQYLYTKLGGNENAKWATFGTYAIIGIILVVLVICLYYIFKFLRKKYKQRRQRAIVSAQ